MAIKYEKVSLSKDNVILSNINLEIEDKSIVAIMGKSECGKTSLIDLLSGFESPTDGKVKIGKTKVGVVFQNTHEQFVLDTVEKELAFSVKHLNRRSDTRKHVLDSLIMVGLDESYLDRKINCLNDSELKKIAIASVLCANPKVIIFDEPTIYLDDESIYNLIKLIKLLKTRYNKTIIVVSRDSDFVHSIADRVIVLNNGEIVLSGTKYEVFTDSIEQYGLKKPKIIEFEKLARDYKNVRLLYRDEINDLMKDIYRYVK